VNLVGICPVGARGRAGSPVCRRRCAARCCGPLSAARGDEVAPSFLWSLAAGALLHALCHAALLEQRSIVSEAARQEGASAAAQGGGRARFLGRDAAGAHYFHFSPLEERVYRLVPDPRGEVRDQPR